MISGQDSLDFQKEMFMKNQSGLATLQGKDLNEENKVYKNFYKQQLDQIVRQKQDQKRAQREKEAREKNMYNERIAQGVEAQKMKDLSYKNYYQMLLNSQSNNTKAYISPFHQRDAMKEKMISNGVEVEKKRSDIWHQQEKRRHEEMKKNYRQLLSEQINEKYHRNALNKEIQTKQKQAFQQITYTPQELAKFQRERKLVEMGKYKEDLDTSSPAPLATNSRVKERSLTGPYIKNDFNVNKIEARHDPMLNPMPYNIQNPYILKEMQRKKQISEQHQSYAHPF